MEKIRLFVENFLIYGLGGIINKIIPLIMVPVVTHLMPDSSCFAVSDLTSTLISIGTSVAVMGMYDAMYRMFFEKEDRDFQRSVCSTALAFTLLTSSSVCLLMLLARNVIARLFFKNTGLWYLVCIAAASTLAGASNSIISAPTRMQNKRRIFLISNTASSLLSYSISIPLLLRGYYIVALPLASLLSHIMIEIIFVILNHNWFYFWTADYSLLKPLLSIAIPLLPNFLIYWVFNSSDKLMITNLIGLAPAGIYSVGAKLGHASQLIYTAFAGGWQYFAFSTMREKDQVRTNSLIFEYLGVISFCFCASVAAVSHVFFRIVFPLEYLSGYIVAPYLFLAPLLQMLFQVAANQFIVIRKTWPNMLILSAGAVANVFLNLLLIPSVGIEGAALATLAGYAVSNIITALVLCQMKLMTVSGRFLLCVFGMTVYLAAWRLLFSDRTLIGIFAALLLTAFYGMLYGKDVLPLIASLRNKRPSE